MNRVKTHVNKGDTVQVITGNHRGAEGKVLQVLRGKNQVLIEGVRMIKKHTRKSQEHPNGAIVERERHGRRCAVLLRDRDRGAYNPPLH